MRIEIWSDIVCPFCYIGKRKFEIALAAFSAKDKVEIEWRSFQLDPTMQNVPGKSVHTYLAERKGCSLEEAMDMNEMMSNVAKEVGLQYNFDIAIISNTLNAHRLLHFAKTKGLQSKLKERLFQAYYTEGKDVSDIDSLLVLASEVGLDEVEVKNMLVSDTFKNEVELDQYYAEQVGARGVPFFVFNNKFAVSGAQPTELFSEILEKVWKDENSDNFEMDLTGGVCGQDGKCD
jgi:predicted DsbA family dithiol-disulfide isomerase